MRPDSQVFLPRFEMLCRSVLARAIWTHSEPLAVSEWACEQRFGIDLARSALAGGSFRPVDLPHAWGPVWSTRWFRLTGRVSEPAKAAATPPNRRLRVRFDPGTEGTVWDARNAPMRGLDENRDAFDLARICDDGTCIDVLIEAACNHPFGEQVFPWDSRERGERWQSASPGLVTRAELAVFDETVWRLHTRLLFATRLLAELDPKSARAQDLYASMRRAADAIDDTEVSGSAPAALELLDAGLERAPGGSSPRLICVAHAHIDTAWLWPIAETRRKTVRSWSNTLELMDLDPSLRFMCSQPQQYKWLEEDAPSLFERITDRVSAGQWEPVGSMWVEPDALVPSGESLIRQVFYGTRYFQSKFPDAPPQRIVFLPDTFGFPACLPSIMRACGMDTFITNKIHWNQANIFPHTSFRWRGLDGSEVLAHNTPGGDYNATMTPRETKKAADNIVGRDAAGLPGQSVALQPFGYGDGGGGPTAEMLERIRASHACEGLPQTELGSVHEFVEALHAEDDRAGGLPSWSGPIDLELHRGTLTSHQWLKRANAQSERGLRAAELLAYGKRHPPERAEDLQRDFDSAWERLLLNQFHDILPGSSIASVYDDARSDHAFVSEMIASIDARLAGGERCVLNASSGAQTGVVRVGTELAAVVAEAFAVSDIKPAILAPVVIEDGRVSNGLVSFSIDASGRIDHLQCAGGADLAADQPLNRLRLYRDRPMNWDAWDIDLDYERSIVWENSGRAEIETVTVSPLRVEIRALLRVGTSRCVQTFRLDAGSPLVEVMTEIDWQEHHRLLRTESSPAIASERVTVGTQFGHVSRPTHRNTGWDRYAFEFACHRWMDLSEPGRGLAVLADAIYGRSAHRNTMGLSLLRSPTHPDPTADRGINTLRYAYLPHLGDWTNAGVDHHAECFENPLRVIESQSKFAPVNIETSPGIRMEIAAYKQAADLSASRVLRIVETRGAHGCVTVRFAPHIALIRRVDALEKPISGHAEVRGPEFAFDVKPHEIVTLLAE